MVEGKKVCTERKFFLGVLFVTSLNLWESQSTKNYISKKVRVCGRYHKKFLFSGGRDKRMKKILERVSNLFPKGT